MILLRVLYVWMSVRGYTLRVLQRGVRRTQRTLDKLPW